jgi:hypothetical protein
VAENAERTSVQSTEGDQEGEMVTGRWFTGTSFGRFRGRCKRFRIVSNDVFCIAVSKHQTVECAVSHPVSRWFLIADTRVLSQIV